MTDTPSPSAPPIKTLRILVGTLAGGLVVFGIVVYMVFPDGNHAPWWVRLGLVGLAVVSHLLCQTKGFNIKPVPAGTKPAEAMAMARTAFMASTVLRFALAEVVAIVALLITFAVHPGSWMTYLVGAELSLLLLGVNVWPRDAVISKVEQQLDQDGGKSFLRDALHGQAPGRPVSGGRRT